MNDTNQNISIGAYIVTKTSLDYFKSSIDRLRALLYIEDVSKGLEIANIFSIYGNVLHIDPKTTISFNNMSESEKERLSALLDSYSAYIDTVSILTLQLSFMPNEDFLGKIHKLISSQISQDFILEVKVDKSVVGGVRIDFNGNFIDLSLNKLIDTYFTVNKNEILSRI